MIMSCRNLFDFCSISGRGKFATSNEEIKLFFLVIRTSSRLGKMSALTLYPELYFGEEY